METAKYKLAGLSKPKSATLEHLDNDRDTFWATIDMPQDRIDALWKWCEGNWDEVKVAIVECDYITEDLVPINGRVVDFELLNQ